MKKKSLSYFRCLCMDDSNNIKAEKQNDDEKLEPKLFFTLEKHADNYNENWESKRERTKSFWSTFINPQTNSSSWHVVFVVSVDCWGINILPLCLDHMKVGARESFWKCSNSTLRLSTFPQLSSKMFFGQQSLNSCAAVSRIVVDSNSVDFFLLSVFLRVLAIQFHRH